MGFDDVLQRCGQFGTFQKTVLYLVLLPTVLPCGFHAYNQIFMSATPQHWCRVPALQDRNLSQEAVRNLSIPLRRRPDGTEFFEECSFYDRNYSEVLGNGKGEEAPCRDGWVYDTSKYSSTVVTEWDLVCEKGFSSTLALVLFGVGGAIGNFIFGYIQDSYVQPQLIKLLDEHGVVDGGSKGLGRKSAFFLYLSIETVFGVASALATDFTLWLLFRFGVGFTVPAILGTPYILSVELVGPEKRAYCTILINVAYSLGLVLLSGLFYLLRDWRQLTLVTTLPFLLLFFYWWAMPESPRWLFAKGRYEECDHVLRKMAAVNRVTLPPNYLEDLKERCQELEGDKDSHHSVADLFRHPNLRKKTLVITAIWLTNTAVYVGLSYYAPALAEDEFLSFFLGAAAELPTYIFLWPAMEKLGRRWTLCSSMLFGGLSCLAMFLTQNREAATLVLYCLAKMGISCSFVVLPLMASELYPTVVRGTGMSFSSVLGQIGPMVIPVVNYLGEEWRVLPLMVMGGLLVVGAGLGLILPETLHRSLPETIEEAEAFEGVWRRAKKGYDVQEDKKGKGTIELRIAESSELRRDSPQCESKPIGAV